MVTDNPDNVILPEQWHPVPDVVETPVKGITLGDGLFRKVMENNVHYLMQSFTLDELVSRLEPVSGKPLHFTVKGCTDIELMPYYEVEGQPFSNFPDYQE